MFKQLRVWWMYWRYRNITRRWQLLKPRLRWGRPPQMHSSTARARGTAMYMPTRSTNARGLLFVTVAAALLAVVNSLLGPGQHFLLDFVIFAVLAYAYIHYFGA